MIKDFHQSGLWLAWLAANSGYPTFHHQKNTGFHPFPAESDPVRPGIRFTCHS
jgi:hypothetical protein